MTDPSEVIAAVVTALRSVPELVTDVSGADGIYAYSDQYPPARSVEDAVAQMPVPSIMVALQRISITDLTWLWQFTLHVRLQSIEETGPGASGVYQVFAHFANGIPDGKSVSLIDSEIHPNFDPIDNVSLERAPSPGGAEHWFIRFDLMERTA
jgi:hypothetical protein